MRIGTCGEFGTCGELGVEESGAARTEGLDQEELARVRAVGADTLHGQPALSRAVDGSLEVLRQAHARARDVRALGRRRELAADAFRAQRPAPLAGRLEVDRLACEDDAVHVPRRSRRD